MTGECCDNRDVVFARWASQPAGPLFKPLEATLAGERPAVVRAAFLVEVWLGTGSKRQRSCQLVATDDWLRPHPNKSHYGRLSDVTAWGNGFDAANFAKYVALQRTIQSGIVTTQKVKFTPTHCETVQTVVPLKIVKPIAWGCRGGGRILIYK